MKNYRTKITFASVLSPAYVYPAFITLNSFLSHVSDIADVEWIFYGVNFPTKEYFENFIVDAQNLASEVRSVKITGVYGENRFASCNLYPKPPKRCCIPKDYYEVVLNKLSALECALEKGYNAVMCDLDILFLSDPLPSLIKSICSHSRAIYGGNEFLGHEGFFCDVLPPTHKAFTDEIYLNAGYMLFTGFDKKCGFIKEFNDWAVTASHTCLEQDFFNDAYHEALKPFSKDVVWLACNQRIESQSCKKSCNSTFYRGI
jgi:Nucleotide-diphospho-sugar transferase.